MQAIGHILAHLGNSYKFNKKYKIKYSIQENTQLNHDILQ